MNEVRAGFMGKEAWLGYKEWECMPKKEEAANLEKCAYKSPSCLLPKATTVINLCAVETNNICCMQTEF